MSAILSRARGKKEWFGVSKENSRQGEGLDAVRRILIPFPFRGIHLLSRGEKFKKFERDSKSVRDLYVLL